jgi:hypothetical protein
MDPYEPVFEIIEGILKMIALLAVLFFLLFGAAKIVCMILVHLLESQVQAQATTPTRTIVAKLVLGMLSAVRNIACSI